MKGIEFLVTVDVACVTRDVIKNAGRAPSIDPKGLDDDVIHNAHSPCVCAGKKANVT